MPRPAELTLELVPRTRFDVIDVPKRIREEYGDVLSAYPRALYCSFHTTAGYFDQQVLARLRYSRQYLDPFVRLFQKLYPEGASYRHDQLELRSELTEAQKAVEPKNADSHLTFMGSGLSNCATYVDGPESVYWVDLDGVIPEGSRRRRTSIVAYERESTLDERPLDVPTSPHPIDSINLKDEELGLFEEIQAWIDAVGLERGRLDLALEPNEMSAGLTVNEFETLLMKQDLPEVLRDPFKFVADRGRSALRDPLAIPLKAFSYARYDLVRVFNEAMDKLHLSDSVLEGLVARLAAVPATRLLALKSSVSLPVLDGKVRCGTYQSPILVQWQKTAGASRRLDAKLVELS